MDGSQYLPDTYVLEGHVKWYCSKKRFGFLKCEGLEEDVLLHAHILQNSGRSSIAEGSVLECLVRLGPNGFRVDEIYALRSKSESDANHYTEQTSVHFEPAKVDWFDKPRGFGFASPFGRAEKYFLPARSLAGLGQDEVSPGEAISVLVEENERGSVVVATRPWV